MRFGMVGDVTVDNRTAGVAWRRGGGWVGEALRTERDICVILRPYVEVLVRFHALGGNACRGIAEVFDGGVDIVAAFRVGCYGGGSRCLVQASAEGQSIYISILINMRAIADYMCWICRRAGDRECQRWG